MIFVNLTSINVEEKSHNWRDSSSIVEQLRRQGYSIEKVLSFPVQLERKKKLVQQVRMLLAYLSLTKEEWRKSIILLPDFELALFGVVLFSLLQSEEIHPIRFLLLRQQFHSTITSSYQIGEVITF